MLKKNDHIQENTDNFFKCLELGTDSKKLNIVGMLFCPSQLSESWYKCLIDVQYYYQYNVITQRILMLSLVSNAYVINRKYTTLSSVIPKEYTHGC